MRTSLRPGSGYDARGPAAAPPPAVEAIAYDRTKRKLKTLDEEEDEKAVVAAANAAAAGEIDPLDAFMASLQPSKKQKQATVAAAPAEEVDPLDAFMSSLNTPAAPAAAPSVVSTAVPSHKLLELDDEDAHASYLASSERRAAQRMTKLESKAAQQGVSLDSLLAREERDGTVDSDDSERDSDDESSAVRAGAVVGSKDSKKKREVTSLAPLDHSTINYPPFQKSFYKETAELASLPQQEMDELTADFGECTAD
jgi:hypothetical protein